jgi:hypothetical protein
MFHCLQNIAVFYVKCFQIIIASPTTDLHVILDELLNFLDFLYHGASVS